MNTPFVRKVVPARIHAGIIQQLPFSPTTVFSSNLQQANISMTNMDMKHMQKSLGSFQPSKVAEAYNNVLEQAICAISYTTGFDELEEGALETLVAIFHSQINRIGEQARLACEVAGRTIPTPGDVWFALINMGISVNTLIPFYYEQMERGTLTIQSPEIIPPENKIPSFHIGIPRSHPQYIYEWMPPFPDPHTYIRTEITNEPDIPYDKVREAMAQKKRNGVTSLINYMVRTYPSFSLFTTFQRMIQNELIKMIEYESCQKRKEEAFVAFRDLLGTNDIENVANSSHVLLENGLINKEEFDTDIEIACMCSDGTILDMNGQILKLNEDVVIDLSQKDILGCSNSRVHCLEAGAETLRYHWNMDEMLDGLIEIDSYALDVSFRERSQMDEMKGLLDKYTYEYIPEWCHILEPSFEHRSYLKFPLSEIKGEEEVRKEIKTEETIKTENNEYENMPDNPYFRDPQIVT